MGVCINVYFRVSLGFGRGLGLVLWLGSVLGLGLVVISCELNFVAYSAAA